MRSFLITGAALVFTATTAFAQADQHDGHHPPESGNVPVQTSPATPAPAPGGAPPAGSASSSGSTQMMNSMPEQCRRAMQGMPQECMTMMQRGMMQGGMMQGGMMQGGMMQGGTNQPGATPGGMGAASGPQAGGMQAGSAPPHGMEMQDAMRKMDPPMMQATSIQDPDEAFIRGMIPHHQAAIDMAQTVLKYGKDEQTRKMATDIIRDQTREIQDSQDWLKKHGK